MELLLLHTVVQKGGWVVVVVVAVLSLAALVCEFIICKIYDLQQKTPNANHSEPAGLSTHISTGF